MIKDRSIKFILNLFHSIKIHSLTKGDIISLLSVSVGSLFSALKSKTGLMQISQRHVLLAVIPVFHPRNDFR